MRDFAERLGTSGMSDSAVQGKLALFSRCATALAALNEPCAARDEPFAFFVPGRIEVLGKHTDYAGGRSLLCAMERGFTVLAQPRDDARVRALDVLGGNTRELSLDSSIGPAPGDWATYLSTVVRRIARDFPSVRRGMDVVFASDLPAASGMSSSSALVIAMFLALEAVNRLAEDPVYRQVITSPESLAEYLGAVENGRSFGPMAGGLGVGTLGGSQDQTAILCCEAGTLSRYSFCPVRSEGEISFPRDRVFVLAYSGVAAEKTASARLRYNEASLAVSEILGLWNGATSRSDPCLADAVTSAANAADEIRSLLGRCSSSAFTPQRLLDRFEQFVTETYDIIPRAADAFARADLAAVGEQVARSQRGAERLLGNQIPETITLTRLARTLGADAASAFGAGFGGSVWALVAADRAKLFATDWLAAYQDECGAAAEHAEIIITLPGPGAMRL